MKSITNKIAHSFILVVFCLGCALTWILLTEGMLKIPGHPLPGFSELCVGMRPIFVALPVLATAYCLWIWFRKADKVPSWIGFFAVTAGSLMLFGFPAVIGAHFALQSVLSGLAR
jgi:hypothetical protein